MNARYYNANTGQFTSRDTYLGNAYNPQTHNLYSYTGNNPTSFVDPTGHAFFLVTALIGAVVGGAIGAYHSYKTTGKVTLKSVVKGALIGGVVGLTLGAGASLALTGGLAASTAAVTSAAGTAVTSAAGGLVAAGTKAIDKVQNITKIINKNSIAQSAKDVVSKISQSVKVESSRTVSEKPIVIGENMSRVKQYANSIGGHAYKPWKVNPSNFELSMQRNQRWINDMMKQGRKIIDIGPDFARRSLGREPSLFYNMERMSTKVYDNYQKVFERTGIFKGGVSGIDW